MKPELNRYLLLAAIQLVALNAVAQPVDTFIHPTRCAIYLGGPDHAADGTAAVRSTTPVPFPAAAAVARVPQRVTREPVASAFTAAI